MKVFPKLIPRAVLMRLRSLDLGGANDYYASSAAESSSTLVASAPQSNNMYVIAYGEKEGLASGERLEMYGTTVRLIRTMAYGCPRGVSKESVLLGAIPEPDLKDITKQLDRVASIYDELDLRSVRQAGSAAKGKETASASSASTPEAVSSTWEITAKAGQLPVPVPHGHSPRVFAHSQANSAASTAAPPAAGVEAAPTLTEPNSLPELSSAELEERLRSMRSSNLEVIVAEWRRKETLPALIVPTNGEAEDDLLVENGVCFSCPEQAGLRVLRAARLAFMSMIERKANMLREAQVRKRVGGEDPRPLVVLDVSGIDFSFSHAAVQSTVELGLHDESQCRINFIPLNDGAAQKVEGALATFVRQVVRAPGVAHGEPFGLLSLRSVDVAAYTAYLDLSPPGHGSGRQAKDEEGSRSGGDSAPHTFASFMADPASGRHQRRASMQLARALATLRSGASMLVSFVPTPRSAAAIYTEVCHGRRAEVAMEIATVAEAKSCVAAAIARCGRWGYLTDEVLPMVDCPQGSAVSLVVTVL